LKGFYGLIRDVIVINRPARANYSVAKALRPILRFNPLLAVLNKLQIEIQAKGLLSRT
jgi:hypothetical protein